MNEKVILSQRIKPSRYEIRPRLGGDGFILTGPIIPWGGWFSELDNAVAHAREVDRTEAGELLVYDLNGSVSWREEWRGDFVVNP